MIFRDRVTYGRQCLDALVAADLDVTIIDHGTTFPEAVDWLARCEYAGVPVWYYPGGNPRDLWGRPQFQEACRDEPFVLTDPDVVPDPGCPADWPQHLLDLLARHPETPKVGLGLRIDDLPDHYPRRRQVIEWENQYWSRRVEAGLLDAGVDTTLAVNRQLNGAGHSLTGMRTDFPYVARHLAWYEDPSNLPEDIAWYYGHIESGISFWTVGVPSCWGN